MSLISRGIPEYSCIKWKIDSALWHTRRFLCSGETCQQIMQYINGVVGKSNIRKCGEHN